MVNASALSKLLKVTRTKFSCEGTVCRIVLESRLLRESRELNLASYVADKAPLFYRDVGKISSELSDGYYISSLKRTLAKIPTAESFKQSHFAEIACGIFAEEVMGLVRIYSKLSLLTAENANAFKMDLVLCDPSTEPLEFVFAEVRSSPKTDSPAKHHLGCYADLFNSFNKYEDTDREFDLGAARDRVDTLPNPLRDRVHRALLPYAGTKVRYVGFVVVDEATFLDSEVKILATRNNNKSFDVDIVCIETYHDVTNAAYRVVLPTNLDSQGLFL
jgi:hypothetical protein